MKMGLKVQSQEIVPCGDGKSTYTASLVQTQHLSLNAAPPPTRRSESSQQARGPADSGTLTGPHGRVPGHLGVLRGRGRLSF